MTAPDVEFKGIRQGLLLMLSDAPAGSYQALLEQVRTELAEKRGFLQGSRVVLDVGSRHLVRAELNELQKLLADHDLALWAVLAQREETKAAARGLGLGTRLAGSATDLDGNRLAADRPQAEAGAGGEGLLANAQVRAGPGEREVLGEL